MATNKQFKSKSAGKQKIEAGKSGQMHKFKGVGDQKPGVSEVAVKNAGKKWPTGGKTKMHGFKGVGTQKAGFTSVETGGKKGSYAK